MSEILHTAMRKDGQSFHCFETLDVFINRISHESWIGTIQCELAHSGATRVQNRSKARWYAWLVVDKVRQDAWRILPSREAAIQHLKDAAPAQMTTV